MPKKLLTLAALLLTVQLIYAYDGPTVSTKVSKVTIFLNSAQVTRTASVSIPAGTSTLVFNDLSPDIDVQSIQVKSAGEFTILSVKHELDFLNQQVKEKRINELETQKKIVQDKLDMQNNLLAIYEEESNMLLKNQNVAGQGSLDLIKLRQALEFQTAKLTEIKKKQQAVKNEITVLTAQMQKYNKQIAEVQGANNKATSNILVTVSSKSAVQSVFMLYYVVNNAAWYPTYDIRAKNVNSPVNITYKANVSQQCGEEWKGEEWKNVKLTLSTGNPTISGSKPELNPFYLNPGMYYASTGSITRVTGKVVDNAGEVLPGVTIRVKGTSIGTVTDAKGNYSVQLPAGPQTLVLSYVGFETKEVQVDRPNIVVMLKESAQHLDEVVVVGYGATDKVEDRLAGKVAGVAIQQQTIPVAVTKQEQQTNIEFDITNPYTIPGDGKQYLVEINSVDINADYRYYTVPKLSTDVFLTATLTDWNQYSFLSGEANLFFEGTFIGKSLIDTHSTNDTLSLSLGTDRNIVVTRTLQKDLKQKKNFGSTIKESRDWLITVKNRKSQPINILVEDQVPVSQNSSINVEVQDVSGAKMDNATGKLSWSFILNSQQDKKAGLKYLVSYPKNQTVIVE
ncbi:mucoidy inhibitor MuiA family protein [Mucilaginibacter limnophilus]|uniref:Mucoidy inhibitor MuiA family protein n=1 Tax=Mucilaginibacter limnophilus TaxID=1932778 RepID=A0A437MQM2_9SPHI|nr:mucoidy inhibitor MuiA family protein [Mucilaginibacter limnophilus]RVT99917.1 mucoidy inhibitor MuiA family protein [Mucilaginibacter limnophilus]